LHFRDVGRMRKFLHVRVTSGAAQAGVNACFVLCLIYENAVASCRFQFALPVTAQAFIVSKGCFCGLRARSREARQSKEEGQS
jgi:hypothetical protein